MKDSNVKLLRVICAIVCLAVPVYAAASGTLEFKSLDMLSLAPFVICAIGLLTLDEITGTGTALMLAAPEITLILCACVPKFADNAAIVKNMGFCVASFIVCIFLTIMYMKKSGNKALFILAIVFAILSVAHSNYFVSTNMIILGALTLASYVLMAVIAREDYKGEEFPD